MAVFSYKINFYIIESSIFIYFYFPTTILQTNLFRFSIFDFMFLREEDYRAWYVVYTKTKRKCVMPLLLSTEEDKGIKVYFNISITLAPPASNIFRIPFPRVNQSNPAVSYW